MDITTIVGPLLAVGMILFGLILEGGHLSSIVQGTAALIVFGGMLGAVLVAYPLPDFIASLKSISMLIKNPSASPDQILNDIIDLAQTARKESILALEK